MEQNQLSAAKTMVDFMEFCNQLKLELRHCWFEGGRRESAAEHSWQLALLAVAVVPHLSIDVSLLRLLKMALIHDLVEIEAKDLPLPERDEAAEREKYKLERQAIENIKTMLCSPLADDIYQLWHEYEAHKSNEAKVLKALDRMEAFIAHNVSDMMTISDFEKQMYHEDHWLIDLCEMDPFLLEMAQIIQQTGIMRTGPSPSKSAVEHIDNLG